MVYKRYGQVFNQIRNQKHLPLSFFESVGINKSSLQRFETGQTMMGFERLDAALQAMNVTLGEYEYFLNYFQAGYLEEIVDEVIGNIYVRNTNRLQLIAQECKESNQMILYHACRSSFEELDEDSVEIIASYLYDIEQWGYFELSIFFISMECFSERTIMHLMNDFWNKAKEMYGVFKYRRRFLETSYKAIIHLSKLGYKNSVDSIIKQSYFSDQVYDMYCENLRRIALGFYKQSFIKVEEGRKEWEKSCQLFEEFGHIELARYYKLILQ
ncbi:MULTISPECIES: Rgg/GadR/MutR family transcriptional regulator [unclassified Lactococcus]|uniref:Rgg/GadR/MutR family transcriptional regulator n=1 Tax=unclassified Lactococcus TaxID=2643510 RepID=UPI0011C893E4|nr:MULTISPECIES: Rgg/GadR/MutR family transcriptional regulator [unclassified Lactococcus]MQW23972.1 Rgg/GadR/MutR family transcriptional regulator [Lactococcus sp. dk101]TXK36915.1 Rgg/GadR/MutR family transcriptional regulator [Lactococcus sp. dk310]TXK47102.1 Rgg/GadR/MutR family transcriptional regulator [Lactococcus sp. dk322]